jgi:Tfp pilus assembly protein PilF
MMGVTVKRVEVILAAFLLACAATCAQTTQSSGGINPNAPVNVRGQVFAPSGGPLQMTVRLQLISDDPSRPPEYIYTDSNGRFVLMSLNPRIAHTVVIETDGQNWATTTERFLVLNPRYSLSIILKPYESDNRHGGKPSISVAELQQNVPRAARREFDLAMDRLRLGETEKARKHLDRAIEIFPDYVEARNELAVYLMKQGQLVPAEAQLRRALDVNPEAVRPLFNLGLCLYRQQRYPDAIPVLQRAFQLDPLNAQGAMLLGFSLVMSGDDTGAELVLLKAYELGGKKVARAQFYLSHIYTRRKDYKKAARALEIYLADVPDSSETPQLQATLAKLRASAQNQ